MSTLLTTAYFPPISYFSALKNAEEVQIEKFENFGKQSYRNRCLIMTANGVIPLTVPVAKANSKTLIKDLKIVYPTPWQKLHFKAIESAYKKSPYYDYYIDDLISFFEKKEEYLFDLNNQILETICDLLKIKTTIRFTEDYIREGESNYIDLRNTFHPKPAKNQSENCFQTKPYHQTFSDRFPFTPNLSIIDLLFSTGPETIKHL